MAYADYPVGDANAVQIWAKEVAIAEKKYLELAPLMGTGDNNVIKIKSDLERGAGDRIHVNLRGRMTQSGVGESDVAEGNGEALSMYQDSLTIGELGFVAGSKSKNSMAQQRVPFDIRAESRDALAMINAERMSVTFFNQVCGNTAQTDGLFTGLNATAAPTAGRKIFAGSASADEDLTSDDTMTLDLIDEAVAEASVSDETGQCLQPIMINGQKKFVMYMHPFQAKALQTNTASGQWLDIRKHLGDHAIYKGALGEHNGVILRKSEDVTLGCNSSTPTTAVANTRRAVLLGRCSAIMGYGQKSTGSNRYRWSEQLFDHGRKYEAATFCHFGMKKSTWNGVDFGAMTISTYSER